MSSQKLFFAGSGGQGVILMGQMTTYAAMYEGKETTYYPSYGPEMRGGTANCTVVVSDRPISCPLIYDADCVVAMNLPSLIKFEQMVKPGGILLLNTSIISQRPSRGDITVYDVPVNELARDIGNARVANMIMLGALVRSTGVVSRGSVVKVMEKTFTGSKARLIDLNVSAFDFWKMPQRV
ncbi:MAG: 2-oxoacid:acceptor oxidoreductase family protein [Oscillospiraceae bacterium]|jgi:2-oxoglutarate ferredoxin oxidoreductase subunit gamma|nr:2-oxoacid:acceptor oxidoreductase family protein [Oscillospiraceae bacterium]